MTRQHPRPGSSHKRYRSDFGFKSPGWHCSVGAFRFRSLHLGRGRPELVLAAHAAVKKKDALVFRIDDVRIEFRHAFATKAWRALCRRLWQRHFPVSRDRVMGSSRAKTRKGSKSSKSGQIRDYFFCCVCLYKRRVPMAGRAGRPAITNCEGSNVFHPVCRRGRASAGRHHRTGRQQERGTSDHRRSAFDPASGQARERSAHPRYRDPGGTHSVGRRIRRPGANGIRSRSTPRTSGPPTSIPCFARASAPRSCWPGRCSPAAARWCCRRPAAT